MTEQNEMDYGPLSALIGTWSGSNGTDIAPEPGGTEKNSYFETIIFEAIGDVTNAESQDLTVLRYHQSVSRKSNRQVFHDQTGYWIWDSQTRTVLHAFVIPRGVNILAGGVFNGANDSQGNIELNVTARLDDPDWGILQSRFMQDNAKTIEFQQQLIFNQTTLAYFQTTVLEIYGNRFEHTDRNELEKMD